MQQAEVFHRPDLAKRLANYLMSEDGSSGVFITGPRRTGKSTFIREDLIPLLHAVHATHVVYVDLWEDQTANPGEVIVDSIRGELLKFESFILKAAKEMGVSRTKVANLEVDLNAIGLGKGETLNKAMTVLAAAAKKPVTLIIDEAQHSQVTEQGRQALYAIKAARDAMNASTGPGFRLLATGSNSDKLATLVEDKDQAFYQAPLIPLPHLGKEYLDWLRERLSLEIKPSREVLIKAFAMCNYRPEPSRAICRELALRLDLTPDSIDTEFEKTVQCVLAKTKANFFQHINGLNPLDAAVLKVMARDGKRFAPYTKQSFVDYKVFLLSIAGDTEVDINQSSVQQALERLRTEKFIWRAGRGAYFIEDPQQAVWLNEDTEQQASSLAQVRQQILSVDGGDSHA